MADDPTNTNGASPQVDASPTEITPAHGGRLVPFVKGDERARELGRLGGQKRAAQAAIKAGDSEALRSVLDSAASTFKRGDLGPYCIAVAGTILGRIQTGAIKVPGSDAAALLRVLVDIARLEAGEPTSAAVIAHLSGGDVRERVEALRSQARQVIEARGVDLASAAALAVADTGGDVAGEAGALGPISADVSEGEGFA